MEKATGKRILKKSKDLLSIFKHYGSIYLEFMRKLPKEYL